MPAPPRRRRSRALIGRPGLDEHHVALRRRAPGPILARAATSPRCGSAGSPSHLPVLRTPGALKPGHWSRRDRAALECQWNRPLRRATRLVLSRRDTERPSPPAASRRCCGARVRWVWRQRRGVRSFTNVDCLRRGLVAGLPRPARADNAARQRRQKRASPRPRRRCVEDREGRRPTGRRERSDCARRRATSPSDDLEDLERRLSETTGSRRARSSGAWTQAALAGRLGDAYGRRESQRRSVPAGPDRSLTASSRPEGIARPSLARRIPPLSVVEVDWEKRGGDFQAGVRRAPAHSGRRLPSVSKAHQTETAGSSRVAAPARVALAAKVRGISAPLGARWRRRSHRPPAGAWKPTLGALLPCHKSSSPGSRSVECR